MPAIALIATILLLVGAIVEDITSSIWAIGLIGLSYPVYLAMRRSRRSRDQVDGLS